MTSQQQPILSCVNLCVGYGTHKVAGPMNFALPAGSYLCIVGRNGSGKSTLVKTMVRLIPPVEGEIRWMEGLQPGKEFGYLAQSMDKREFPATVREVVASGCVNRLGFRPMLSREMKQLIQDNMLRFHVDDLASKSFNQLSGGQQQRVLLARSLCASGRVLFVDEPVTGLDPSAAREMYEAVEGLHREGVTVLMVSHDLDATRRYATHVLHINHHECFFGERDAYLRHPLASTWGVEEAVS